MGGKKTSKSKHVLSQEYSQDDDRSSSSTSGSAGAPGGPPGGPPGSGVYNPDHFQDSGLNALKHEIQGFRDHQVQLKESFENFQAMYQHKYSKLAHALQEDRHRCQLLKAQLNDLFEQHWNENMILRQELALMEEKSAFMDQEISMDVHEALDACKMSLLRLEHQQNTELHEALEHHTAERHRGQFSVLLALTTAMLICAPIVVNFGIPLLKTCWDILLTLFHGLLLLLQTFG